VEICEDVKDYSNTIRVPVKELENVEMPDEELLAEYVSLMSHFTHGHVKRYKRELREEILRRMGEIKSAVAGL